MCNPLLLIYGLFGSNFNDVTWSTLRGLLRVRLITFKYTVMPPCLVKHLSPLSHLSATVTFCDAGSIYIGVVLQTQMCVLVRTKSVMSKEAPNNMKSADCAI